MNSKHYMASVAALALLASLSTSALWAAEESQAALKAEAKVTLEAATQTALAKVPGGKIKSSELEREHGKLIWSFDISKPKTRNIAEVQVDAKTGTIVSETTETPKQQRAEDGYAVDWVQDGVAAAAALRDTQAGYALALLDWGLPGRDGLSVLKAGLLNTRGTFGAAWIMSAFYRNSGKTAES